MEYFENTLCVEAGWLQAEDIMSNSAYKSLKARGILQIERRACKNTPALINYNSIPDRFKKLIEFKVGDPYRATRFKHFTDHIKPDPAAAEFFSNYKLLDSRNLKPETQKEYNINASMLNAVAVLIKSRRAQRRALGGQTNNIWETVAHLVEQLKSEYKHTLPSNPRRLYDKYRKYNKEGYQSLIHKNFCNDHSRKVDQQIESLILSLYCMPEKPYSKSVNDLYLQFLGGAIEVTDTTTGEIFQPDDFKNSKGEPIVLSDSTIWNYINLPKNRILVDKLRNDSKYFNDHHRPHHHRTSPVFSLSKISMDDRDLVRKMHDGKRVKAYYAYDVASGAVVGASYSRDKDTGLFIDCMRDMFRFIEVNGLKQPLEVEVEHHLVNQFANDLMKAGVVFQFVRWCNAGNSQEKRAEHFNRAKKYGFEKRYQTGIGRFTAKLEANRPRQVGEWNGDGMRIKEKTYSYDELVADDLQTIVEYNNAPHPQQKTYPGKTRLQVLKENQNPAATDINKVALYYSIGNKTNTSIRRSQYVRVQHENYMLPSPATLDLLEPNNYDVVACWLPAPDGEVKEVYIYQNDLPIACCKKVDRYNEAAAEQTDADRDAFTEQSKYVAKFDAKVKAGKNRIAKVQVFETNSADAKAAAEVYEVTDINENKDFDLDNYDAPFDNAINDF